MPRQWRDADMYTLIAAQKACSLSWLTVCLELPPSPLGYGGQAAGLGA